MDEVEYEETSDEEITTSVDHLLELLKAQEKIPMSEAAQKLGVSLDVVQSWVDFLVEEQIVGIEYKFTKPFIYLNKPDDKKNEAAAEEQGSLESIKDDFVKKAQDKSIPHPDIHTLWKNHVEQALASRKDFFFREAERRGLDNPAALWEEYTHKIIS